MYYYNKGYKTYEQILKYIVELKQKSNKIKSKYNPKNHLEQLNISLRESTVKQVNKLNENSEEDKIKVIKNKNLSKSGTKDKILKFYKWINTV